MKKTISSLHVWLIAALLAGVFAVGVQAAEEKDFDRLEGLVQLISWDTSTVTVGEHMTAQGNRFPRHVMFNNATKFTYRNEPSSVEMLKEGRRVICLGKYDSAGKFQAIRIDVRNKN
jgi:hypothetical protein